MTRRVTIYRTADGQVLRQYSGPAPDLQLASGEAFIEGHFTSMCHRVEAGEVVRFDPPARVGMEWDTSQDAYVVTAAERARQIALLSIVQLEARQARAIREQLIGRGGTPAELKQRLEAIDDQITALRATLNE